MQIAKRNRVLLLFVAALQIVACTSRDPTRAEDRRTFWSVVGWGSASTIILARLDAQSEGHALTFTCDSAGIFTVTLDGVLARRSTPRLSCEMLSEVAGLSKSADDDIWLAGRALRADGLAVLRGRRLARTWLGHCDGTRDPSWQASSNTVAFIANCRLGSGGEALYIAHYPDTVVTVVPGSQVASRNYLHNPSWSHDGTKLVYSRGSPGLGADLLVARIAGERTIAVEGRGYYPSWHPTRDIIAYVVDSASGGSSIHLRTIGASDDSEVVSAQALRGQDSVSRRLVLGPPRWSSDARYLAFSTGERVFVLDVETSRLTPILGGNE